MQRLKWLLIVTLCLCATSTLKAERPKISKHDALVDAITEQAQKYFDGKGLAGLSLGFYSEGESFILSFGVASKATRVPITPETIFEMGSVTKVFTSTDLALEVLRGKMSLDDPISKYLPSLQKGRAINNVTLKHLATHTSSLPRVPPKKFSKSYEALLNFTRRWEPKQAIGSKFLYSNYGFGLLGFAIANVNRQPYEEVIQKAICYPLGMTSTFVEVPKNKLKEYATGYTDKGKPVKEKWQVLWTGSGSIRSTARDMIRFLEGNLGMRGPAELIKAMQFAQEPQYKEKTITMGLGWQRSQHEGMLIVDKNGAVTGFSTYIGMSPTEKMGIVLLSNQRHKGLTELGRKILENAYKHKTAARTQDRDLRDKQDAHDKD